MLCFGLLDFSALTACIRKPRSATPCVPPGSSTRRDRTGQRDPSLRCCTEATFCSQASSYVFEGANSPTGKSVDKRSPESYASLEVKRIWNGSRWSRNGITALSWEPSFICEPPEPIGARHSRPAQITAKQGEEAMADKGQKDKDRRKVQKKAQLTLKEKRKLKKEKKA